MMVLGSALWRRICSYARIPNLFAWSEVLDMGYNQKKKRAAGNSSSLMSMNGGKGQADTQGRREERPFQGSDKDKVATPRLVGSEMLRGTWEMLNE